MYLLQSSQSTAFYLLAIEIEHCKPHLDICFLPLHKILATASSNKSNDFRTVGWKI